MPRTLPAAVADALLDRLSTDEAFRATFRRSPKEALAELGYAPARGASLKTAAGEDAWACLHGEGLPSAEALVATRDALRAQLTSGMTDVVFAPTRS